MAATSTSAPLPRSFLTSAEFLDWYRHQEGRFEYVDGTTVGMAGASPRHNGIEVNLISLLQRVLAMLARGSERDCRVFGAGQMISCGAGSTRYRHPDASIVCGDPEFERGTLLNPTVLIEVLSDSTEGADRGEKWNEYRRIPSLQDYLLVAQREVAIDHFQRRGDLWVSLDGYRAEDDKIVLADATILPVREIYEGVWALPDDRDAPRQAARQKLLASMGGTGDLTQEELDAVRDEWK